MAWWDSLVRKGNEVSRSVRARESTTERDAATRAYAQQVFSRPATPNTARPIYPAQATGVSRPQARPQPVERPAPARPAATLARTLVQPTERTRPPSPYPASESNQQVRETAAQPLYPATATATPPRPGARGRALQAEADAREEIQRERFQQAWMLGNVREMSEEDYAALSPRQQAAVQFNTGLVGAVQADRGVGVDHSGQTRAFLADLGNVADDTEIREFLSLDRAIGTSILEKLDDIQTNRTSTEALRAARGTGAPEAQRFANARSDADRAAELLARSLVTAGRPVLGREDQVPGFGTSPRDLIIQRAYLYMIRDDMELSPQEIAQGLAEMNAAEGTDVSPQDVWEYARANIEGATMYGAGNNPTRVPAPEVDPITGETISPLDIAEIRRRYGL